MTKSKGVSVSIAANKSANKTADISEEGYTGIGVVGITPNVYGVVSESWAIDKDDQNIDLRVANTNNYSVNPTVWCTILYIKNDLNL